MIINCCGTKSCTKTNYNATTRQVSTAGKTYQPAAADETLPPNSEIDPVTSVENIVEPETISEADAESSSVFADSKTSTSEAASSSTSTSTTTTTTSTSTTSTTTTTTTTTTTPPPTAEELVLGKCDSTFTKDVKMFDTDGSLKDPEKYGFWVNSCDQLFVFGKSLVTWRDNFIRCAKIGMKPVEIENDNKLQCLKNLASTWKYGSNYWTSGLRTSVDGFSWCNQNGTTRGASLPAATWEQGQPDNLNKSENCMHLNITRANASVVTTDKKCTNIYVFACQGAPTPAPPCSSPSCPNVTCEKNSALFTNVTKNGKVSQYLTNPAKHGNWYSKNGRFYVFSYANQTETYAGASKACCEFGMTLLSLQFDYKYKAITAGIEVNMGDAAFYWTSGTDTGCESNFGYCAVKRLLRDEAVWQPGQPDNANGQENYVAVYINSSSAMLADFSGETKFRYICEGRDNSRAESGGKGVRDECAAIYNISSGELDTLMGRTDYDLRTKCFLKCVGENSGLMINGKFVENEVLSILEKMAKGNLDDLRKNLMVIDDCGNGTEGMDECDKASQMIKCTKEKAPDVVMGVVSEMEKAISAEEAAQGAVAALPPVEPKCVLNFTCDIIPEYRQLYENTTTVGSGATPDAYVDSACRKKYVFLGGSYSFDVGMTECCKYGLRLATLESLTEINCIAVEATYVHKSCLTWVAASREGGKPFWCYNSSMPMASSVTSDPDVTKVALMFDFATKALVPYNTSSFSHVLCEEI
ncbi:uncharacterized protein LOC135946356 [Cloeon dipterum]|uniref:uncharacterized protein LOC135946356 n=1 Tax=Cloeon dipterum TaxID=197152 RepID=UPI0032204F9F